MCSGVTKIVDRSDADDDVLFRVRNIDTDEVREAFLVTDEDGTVHAWLNYCQHITTVSIHKGELLPRRGAQVVCQNHGAMFNIDDGLCTHGPCEGATLERLAVTVEDGVVKLTDEAYEFVGLGGIEDDGLPSSTTGEGF